MDLTHIFACTAQTLPPYHATIGEPLEHWAKAAPDRVFLAQRDAEDAWRTLSYAQVLATIRRIGAALLRRGPAGRGTRRTAPGALLVAALALTGLFVLAVTRLLRAFRGGS